MKLEFLHKFDTDRLILIVAGWGSDGRSFPNIQMSGWDIAVISGLDSQLPDLELIAKYKTIYLYAWSLGVWSTQYLLGNKIKATKAFAVNGTTTPCNDDCGIPVNIFNGTLNSLNERNLYKFRVRMCGGVKAYQQCKLLFEHIADVNDLRNQLMFVRDCPEGVRVSTGWDAAFISDADNIFPAKNQENAWHGVTRIYKLNAPHYVDLQQIISQTIIDVDRVGKRFTRSLQTYDAHSHAQRLIAERLADKMQAVMTLSEGDVLEIGCGTGNFTREWSKHFKADRAIFMDLCDMPQFGVAPNEIYIKGDAESLVDKLADEQPASLAAIFSASAIQWFSNLPLFFSRCATALHSGGFIAMSTFAPGNLEELQTLRPDHLQYLDKEEHKEILSELFSEVIVEEEKIELEFSSPLEALRHLQLTGVTTSGSRRASVSELRRFADRFPMNARGRYTLTFRPIYLLARR
ncbi:MAG: DUF452 family protein [Prevotella sp.]|nr:DUF452 family protein [Prevotella sp.]MCM1075690.1 DUF452 family protein [Ruminococcus sp.]